MSYFPERPLVVQSDLTVLLEVQNPLYETARDVLGSFCELEKSPEHIHTYRITPLSLWNAAALGLDVTGTIDALQKLSKYPLPANVRHYIIDYMSRYGRLQLTKCPDGLLLSSDDAALMTQVRQATTLADLLLDTVNETQTVVSPKDRGRIKQELLRFGYPVEDRAGFREGAPLPMTLHETTRAEKSFALRPYQKQAVQAFWASGNGVVVLPCGAGKTVVALGVMAQAQTNTLILATNITAVRQWIEEIKDKLAIDASHVGEYSGERKEILPITVSTYQILTYRRQGKEFPHFHLFDASNWGLIIYDEVHLLPAEIFRKTSELQTRRRLGLTATLVREDGKEGEVFTLIGPRRFEAPWRMLEAQGWIAAASCIEVRLALPDDQRIEYAMAKEKRKYRLAAENPCKDDLVVELLHRHQGDQVLIIGQYVSQLTTLAQRLDLPLITGQVPSQEREKLYAAFRNEEIKTLVVSRVANFAVDLPTANVAIQVSGTFGSRQEEAQRLGRILRPKPGGGSATFYTLVSRDTKEQEFASHRQIFLAEQGYRYEIAHWPSPSTHNLRPTDKY